MTNSRAKNKITTVMQLADQTVNNSTTLVNSELSLPVKSGKTYSAILTMFYSSGTTPDFKYQSVFSGSATLYARMAGSPGYRGASDTGTTNLDSIQSNGNSQTWMILFRFKATNTGTCIIQFAQNTQDVSDTKLLIGSTLQLTESQ